MNDQISESPSKVGEADSSKAFLADLHSVTPPTSKDKTDGAAALDQKLSDFSSGFSFDEFETKLLKLVKDFQNGTDKVAAGKQFDKEYDPYKADLDKALAKTNANIEKEEAVGEKLEQQSAAATKAAETALSRLPEAKHEKVDELMKPHYKLEPIELIEKRLRPELAHYPKTFHLLKHELELERAVYEQYRGTIRGLNMKQFHQESDVQKSEEIRDLVDKRASL